MTSSRARGGILGGFRRFLLTPQRAEIALQFTTAAVSAARIETARGRAELRALVSVPLPAGSFAPSLEDPGFRNPDGLRDAVRSALSRLGAEPAMRTALVVPDVVARFRLFPLTELLAEPARRPELVAFRMQKLLPFPVAEARVVTAFPTDPEDPVVAIGFSSAVLRAYEHAVESFGLDVGQVEAASMALLRGMTEAGDALLVHHDAAWLTITLLRDGWPVAIRAFDGLVSGNTDEIRREVAATGVFWRDRLAGRQITGAVVHAADPWFESLEADIARSFGVRASRAQPPGDLTVAGVPPAIERLATPALTLLGAA